MKKVILWTFTIIFFILLISHIFCLILSNVNFKKNSNIWEELNYTGIIYNQHNFGDLKYGLGDIAKNGCGAVAVYNILILEGKYKPLPEVIKYFDNSNENLYGILGTNPFSIANYMKKEGYEAKIYFKASDFKTAATSSKYAIMMYFNLNGGHFQLLHNYDGEKFDTINTTGKTTMEHLLDRTEDCVRLLITII